EKDCDIRGFDDLEKDDGIELVKDADIAETGGRHAAEQAEIYNLDLDHSSKVLSMQKDDSEVQEVVEVVTTVKLITDVVTAASQVSDASATISSAKPSIPAAAPTTRTTITDRTPILYGYPLDSSDDSSDEDLSETAESLHTQTVSTLIVHPPPTRSLPTSHVLASQLRKEIPMPLGYRAAINRWRTEPLSTWYLLLPLELPSSSRKRYRPLSPSLPPPIAVSPPPEHIESVGDNLEASI
nr:hypothetical protein [Tanacetum cinerariifolium]